MPVYRINEFPEGSGSLTSDDLFLFMDDPSGSGTTKKISLSQINSAIGGGGGDVSGYFNTSLIEGSGISFVYDSGNNTLTINSSGLANSGINFQVSTIDLHNGGVENAQIFQFDDDNYQSVITGPTPPSGNNAQRIIIQGQKGIGGEGGDVYVWGGDADTNGGDIKIYAGDADSNESGYGGYINIDAGNGFNQGGQVSISAGNSSTQGGNVNISAGYPSGNVNINTNAGTWAFNADGTVDLPSFTLNAGLDGLNLKSSSAYVQLYYESGPSGTPDNYIENPSNNSEAYLWTTFEGTHIQNVRANDGTNPSWNYEWHFRNDGKLEYPDGTTDSGGTVITPGTYNIQSIDNTLIQTRANAQAKSWNFEINGHLILPSGSILSETNNTLSLMPPTAQSGQSLVVRPTAAIWSIDSSGYIVYGNPITISVNQQYGGGGNNYFGTVNYSITGSGVTQASLGRALTGNVVFSGPGPETETITWTIPANSDISEFTLTLTSVDGTLWDGTPEQTDPALYYSFEENAMPSGQFVTVTNSGVSNSEHSHIHLIAGDPSTVDIYLGDDDQYIKIEKDGGDVIVGTNSNTHHWTFGTDGQLTLPASGSITFPDNTTQTTAWTGTISSASITDFSSSVSGLLPVKNIFGGNGVSVSSVSGEYTISASGVAAGSAESILTNCFNNTGSTLSKGTVVYINGRSGNLPTVQKSIAINEAGSSKTYGILFEDITDNHSGRIIVVGALTDFDTNQFSAAEGSTLYLSPSVSGAMTATKPSAPDHLVSVGKIVRNHNNHGIIQVVVQNGFELDELHNVSISGVAHNDVLVYNSGVSLWENNNNAVFSDTNSISGASGINNMVYMNQASYDSLVVKDPNTLYFIV